MEGEFQQYPFIEYKQELKKIHSEHDLFLSTKINRINIVKHTNTGRHYFGKDPWCSPYLLQETNPFSFLSLAWLCLLAQHPPRSEPRFQATVIIIKFTILNLFMTILKYNLFPW